MIATSIAVDTSAGKPSVIAVIPGIKTYVDCISRSSRNCNFEEGTILVTVTASLGLGRCVIKKHLGDYFRKQMWNKEVIYQCCRELCMYTQLVQRTG
jgi:hypothetical protein